MVMNGPTARLVLKKLDEKAILAIFDRASVENSNSDSSSEITMKNNSSEKDCFSLCISDSDVSDLSQGQNIVPRPECAKIETKDKMPRKKVILESESEADEPNFFFMRLGSDEENRNEMKKRKVDEVKSSYSTDSDVPLKQKTISKVLVDSTDSKSSDSHVPLKSKPKTQRKKGTAVLGSNHNSESDISLKSEQFQVTIDSEHTDSDLPLKSSSFFNKKEDSSDSDAPLKPNPLNSPIRKNTKPNASESSSDQSTESDGDSDNEIKFKSGSEERAKSEKASSRSGSSSREEEKKKESEINHFSEKSTDEERENDGASAKKSNNAKQTNKGKSRLENMKKYVRECGHRVASYDKFFEGSKSEAAKMRKLIALLEDLGVKGRPTLEKCRKARKKLEKRKEFEELDRGNIIESAGRPKRNAQSTVAIRSEKRSASPDPNEMEFKSRFKRLKGFIDSDSD